MNDKIIDDKKIALGNKHQIYWLGVRRYILFLFMLVHAAPSEGIHPTDNDSTVLNGNVSVIISP